MPSPEDLRMASRTLGGPSGRTPGGLGKDSGSDPEKWVSRLRLFLFMSFGLHSLRNRGCRGGAHVSHTLASLPDFVPRGLGVGSLEAFWWKCWLISRSRYRIIMAPPNKETRVFGSQTGNPETGTCQR